MSTANAFRSTYGPCALIAGAAVGLGAEYSRQVAAHGLDLVLLDRDAAPLAATADEIRARYGVQTRTITVDLGRPDLVETIRPSIADREIGLLIYNAAIGTVAPFLDVSPEHGDAMLDVNCRGPMRLVHALAPPMVQRGRGGIVLMSSMSGNVGSAQLAVYAATKAFTLVLGDALWWELSSASTCWCPEQTASTTTTSSATDSWADGDGLLEDAQNRPARFTLLTQKGRPNLERGAAVIRDELKKIGLTVDVVALDAGAVIDQLLHARYEALYFNADKSDLDPGTNPDFWFSFGSAHMWNLEEKAPVTDWERRIDELMARQIAALDEAERKTIYNEVQKIFYEHQPIVYFVAPRIYVAHSSRVVNLTPSEYRPQLFWRPETVAVVH